MKKIKKDERDMKKKVEMYLKKNPEIKKTLDLFNVSKEQYQKDISSLDTSKTTISFTSTL